MLKTITPAEMKRVETFVMENTAITGEQLMQRAAEHVAQAVRRRCGQQSGMVLCVCGTGNNGGDGMAAMRILAEEDDAFRGVCWILPGRLSPDAERELARLQKTAVSIERLEAQTPLNVPANVICVVDALFGTGLARPLEGVALAVCRLLNALKSPVIAVDIPSGLDGATGAVPGEAVRADETVVFHRPKPGLYLGDGPDYVGAITVADIGIPPKMDDAEGFAVMEQQDLRIMIPARKRVSHKGSYGRVLLLAGSRGMAGAAALAAMAALRTGAGLVTVACPEGVLDIIQILCPCATCLPLPEDTAEAWLMLEPALEKADALGVGCGLGTGAWAEEMVVRVAEWLEKHERLTVLDADALNLVAKNDLRAVGGKQTFLTPHPAEAARLLGWNVPDVTADAPRAARELQMRFGTNVILKGACSVLDDGVQAAINPFGTPAMAKGGSGDVLTGVLAALLAGAHAGTYEMKPLALMQTACALHGLAGRMAAEQHGERGTLATEICEHLGEIERGMFGFQKSDSDAGIRSIPGGNVTVIVEHRIGERDEEDQERIYGLNCGYVQEVLEEQNEWQDACICGETKPLEWFEGSVAAVLHCANREIWAVVRRGATLSEDEIRRQTAFLGTVDEIRMQTGS